MKTHQQNFRAASATRSGPRPGNRHRLLYLGLLLLGFCANCGVLQGDVPILGRFFPGKSGKMEKQAELLVEVQESLLRFADEYSMRMVGGVDNLRRGTDALSRAEVLQLKIAIGSETWSIASGGNAVADLLDMTVFVTVMRMTLEDYSQPKVFGKSALPMLAYSRSAEADIWKLAGKVLKPEQQTDLRQSIAAWHRQNPLPESLVALRSLDFASRVEALEENEVSKPGSVFGLLNFDPLAGMEPAVREVAQTRMFGERALFLTQKMPTLLRWQTELLSINAVEMPAVQQLISNSTQLSGSVERFARVAEQLPEQLSTERAEIVKELQAQEKDIALLMGQGTQFSASLNTTFTTFDALMQRFGVGEPKSGEPPPANAVPFRIQDYTQSAAQIEATAGRLTELLGMLNRTMGFVQPRPIFGAGRPGRATGTSRRERGRGLRLLERHSPCGHRVGGRAHLPLPGHPLTAAGKKPRLTPYEQTDALNGVRKRNLVLVQPLHIRGFRSAKRWWRSDLPRGCQRKLHAKESG